MKEFNIIAEPSESTVVTEYKPLPRKSEKFQSEAELEKEFISLLQEQGYEYLSIHEEKDLILNLRKQLEKLNNYTFSDNEWNYIFNKVLSNSNLGIKEKTRIIQEYYRYPLKKDDGTTKNINFIDKTNIHNNILQVINQYEVTEGNYDNRYDVTILVNGLPLVHIELKRRDKNIKEAFNQIERYQRDSFWAGSGLFEYVQLFVISNGVDTKYYSNSTRFNHINDLNKVHKEKTSNSFEFTSYWADANNTRIPDIVDFTKTFFQKHTILNILTKYCIFTTDEMLIVMRPYQIVATEKIINKIEVANNYKKYGTIDGGGYIWHTTGSGKTLTSFKTARICTTLPYIDKVLFVVDRKDLDYQTMKEYDKFEKGAANSNTSTAKLKYQLEKPDCKIIITTIQKLSTFIRKNKDHDIYDKHVVIIFDECHRSQFGDMHLAITKHFKKYHLFGFTGTPIFAVNANQSGLDEFRTTEQVFGEQLHTYTIVDAINDGNVLPFRVDYLKTMDIKKSEEDKDVYDIDREKAYLDPKRIEKVTEYILKHFNQKTYRNEQFYSFNVVQNIKDVIESKNAIEEIKEKQRISGFNSKFAVSSIEAAKLYYNEFKKQMEENPSLALKVGVIYSFGANEEENDGILGEENSENTEDLDQSSRDFLESAIQDYNKMFNTNYDTSADKFQNYYKDVSMNMKNKKLDLLIVVNMFLTGFDATTLNTLWVDKNLKMHGLIQAFSRTNRILNSIKTFGNIVCFRNLQKKTDDAISLFGDKKASGIIILKTFKDYYYGFKDKKGREKKGYKTLIEELETKYPLESPYIEGEKNKLEFVSLYGSVLRLKNLLSSFDDFKGKEILSERDFQDYTGRYLTIKDEIQKFKQPIENINKDLVFEIELIKQIDINIDYILLLVKKYHDSHCNDKELLISIKKAIESSPELRSKKALIENFIANINDVEDILTEWRAFIAEKKEEALMEIINEENLKEAETRKFMEDCFKNGEVKAIGTDVEDILPPISIFAKVNRFQKKKDVVEKLTEFFNLYYNIM